MVMNADHASQALTPVDTDRKCHRPTEPFLILFGGIKRMGPQSVLTHLRGSLWKVQSFAADFIILI